MRLKAVVLENFRLYQTPTHIEFNDLTAFIGRNDYGKSSILEALAIFFENGIVKIDASDPCVRNDSKIVRIGCVFDNLPEELILDATANTSLNDEYLLNRDGDLEIHKEYDCNKSRVIPKVYALAQHPSASGIDDLLLLKQSELKERFRSHKLDEQNIDMRVNASIRQAIWQSYSEEELSLQEKAIQLDQEDAKKVWEQLSRYLPTFALFQADRPSTDADAEVQDPMKLAIAEAIRSVEKQLQEIKEAVEKKALDVAKRTLDKLSEMDEALASELTPSFSSEPKWEGFKLSLVGDEGIPINKRGSGVRRLILLNFFRAEAERKARQEERSIIYAIEEPEVSQHPANQELLVNALTELSEDEGCQVIITTHVPKIAGLLPLNNVRLIQRSANGPVVRCGSEDVYKLIVDELGVLPDPSEVQEAQNRLKVIVCVEGKNDRTFLHHLSRLLRSRDDTLPDLENDSRVTIIPLQGTLLKQWVFNDYLRHSGIPEVHIYDRDNDNKYQGECDSVNNRNDRSYATLTGKREIESYLHPDVINEVFGTNITFKDITAFDDDIPKLVVDVVKKVKSNPMRKKLRDGNRWESNAKRYLNDDAASKMTLEYLDESDPNGDIESWLRKIAELLT